jgi:hypothetical protein
MKSAGGDSDAVSAAYHRDFAINVILGSLLQLERVDWPFAFVVVK